MSTPHYGFVTEDGKKLELDAPNVFKAFYKRFAGHEVEIELRKRRTRRSDKQNKAFHAALAGWALSEGHNIEDLKDDVLAEVFGLREVVSPITGEVRKVLAEPHSSALDTVRFAHLMERTAEIAAGCGYIIEMPDEYTARKKADAKRTRAA